MGKFATIIILAAVAFVGLVEFRNLNGGSLDPRSFFGGGETVGYPEGTACSDLAASYAPSATPEGTYQLELDIMGKGAYCYDLPIFDEQWRRNGTRLILDEKYRAEERRLYQGYRTVATDEFAVVYYPDKRDAGPVFLRKTEEGWILDRSAVERYIRYELSGTVWYALDGEYEYLPLLQSALQLRYIERLDGTKGYQAS